MAKQVLVPPLGTTVDTVTLVSWYKAEGEAIRKGEPLFVIETDKANLDVESPASGILRGVNAVAGDELKALTVIAYIADADEAISTVEHPKPAADEKATESIARPEPIVAAKSTGGRVFISPRARRLAEENHIPINQLKATGPEGAIIERDVRQYLQSQVTSVIPAILEAPVVAAAPTQQLAGSRAEVATCSSQNVATSNYFTLASEADVTQLAAWRSKLLETNIKPTLNCFILYALSQVLKVNPHLITELVGGAPAPSPRIDIGLAVAGRTKFMFPVIRGVDHKGLAQLAAEERDLNTQAASGSLQQQADEGCLLRLCNLGEYEIDSFTPWIDASLCPVVGVGRIKEHRDILDGKVINRQMVWLSFTADNRQMDGLPAALVLQSLVRFLENPILLIGL